MIAALLLLAVALAGGNALLWNVDGAPQGHDLVAIDDAPRETAIDDASDDDVAVAGAAERETASAGEAVAVADAVFVLDLVGGANAPERETASGVETEGSVVDDSRIPEGETASVGNALAVADADGVAAETLSADVVRETVEADLARETAGVDGTVATAANAADIPVRPLASIVLPPQAAVCPSGTCGTDKDLAADRSLGTALTWAESVDQAARQAQDEGKLVFLIHVSGNFELPGFT